MPIFTAVAAAVSAFVGGGLFGAVAGFAARTLLTVGITKLIANRAGKTAAGTQDAGSRVQLPPASNNKVPVVYGTAYMAPIVTDAKISEDQKTMWYVCTLAEVTDSGGYTFGDIYWGGKKCVFDGTDTAKVIQLETNSDPVQVDDKVNGKIYIYRFPNGSSSGIDTGGSSAITLLSDSSIPADLRWNGPLYTTGGQSASMTNTAFVVVKVIYDNNAGTQRLEAMNVELTNSLTKPGDVINDYMQNSRYGCAIPASSIDSASITTLNDYSDELITYIPVGGGTATQPRYRINGPVNTGQNCLNNLQELVDTCDTWLQYSELSGKWTMVVNKPYDWDGSTLADLYQVTDYNLISGISVNPIDLNNAYNELEVQFPDNGVNDQVNFNVINLIDFAPEVMSPNEPENKLTVQFPQVNNYIQATYLGIRRMLQSREDLVIDFNLDYSGIQVVAGDVICIPYEPYGWEAFNSGYGKLFRVSQVQEAKLDDGSLGARITAFEYNQTIYADDPIQDYQEAANTGLTDPTIINAPGTPTFTTNPLSTSGAVVSFKMSTTVPTTGSIISMDFNLGNSSNVQTHKLYTTLNSGDGIPFTNGQALSIDINDQPVGTYYGSVTARTIGNTGVQSNSSSSFVWDPGLHANSVTFTNLNNSLVKSQILAQVFFKIPNVVTNTVTMPVDITTGAFNVPVYLDGTTVGSSDLFPWYQGTSSIANGYSQNSTSSFNPAQASLLALSSNGTDNWWVYMYDTVTISNGWTIGDSLETSLVSDSDTLIQICPFFTSTVYPGILIGYTYLMDTYTLKQNLPIKIVTNTTFAGASSTTGYGYLIRNMVVGTKVTGIAGTLNITRNN